MAHPPTEQGRIDALEREVAAHKEALETVRSALAARRAWRSKVAYLVVASVVLALAVTGVATGVTGDTLKEGVRNPTTGAATAETQIWGNHGGFVTRQSNTNIGDGGGAVYGCRSSIANEPCLYSNNLNNGRAFVFISSGSEGGYIKVDGPNAKPFETNATAVATGLNADRVDGFHANELARVGYSQVEEVFLGPFSPRVTTTITAPTPGFVFVNGVASASTLPPCTSLCSAFMQLSESGTANKSPAAIARFYPDTIETMSQQWVVAAGPGSHTYRLDVGSNPNSSAYFSNPSITAVFIPFGPTGSQAVP